MIEDETEIVCVEGFGPVHVGDGHLDDLEAKFPRRAAGRNAEGLEIRCVRWNQLIGSQQTVARFLMPAQRHPDHGRGRTGVKRPQPAPGPDQCLISGLSLEARCAAPSMPRDSSQLPSIW